MVHANQKGFTIIEVILFLALSALFLTIAFMGVRGRTANVQFTDSMRSLQSFLVSEQNKLTNGVNPSTSPPTGCGNVGDLTGESNACILVGRVVRFGKDADPSVVNVRVLYGDKPSAHDISTKSDLVLINESNPHDDGSGYSNGISWGTGFNLAQSVNLNPAGPDTFDSIGWLRSPGSTRVVPIAFKSSVTDLDGDYYKPSASETSMANEVQTRLCFEGNEGRVAAIYFGDGAGKASIELVFDDTNCK